MWLLHHKGCQKIRSQLQRLQHVQYIICLFFCTLWFAFWIDREPEEADLVAIGIQGLILALLQTKSLLFQGLHILAWLEFS